MLANKNTNGKKTMTAIILLRKIFKKTTTKFDYTVIKIVHIHYWWQRKIKSFWKAIWQFIPTVIKIFIAFDTDILLLDIYAKEILKKYI